MKLLKSFHIDDDLNDAERSGIEVTVTTTDGRRRWWYFMTPAALRACGDWIPGTRVRIHAGAPHMIVVSELDSEIIARVLQHLDESDELLSCTRALDEGVTRTPGSPARK